MIDGYPDIQTVGKAMATGLRQRSPLVIWFIENHDDFAALLAKYGADWKGLSKHFADTGLVGRSGKPLTPRSVETYWYRAHRYVTKQRTSQLRPRRNEGRGVSDAERRALGDPTAPADPAAKPEPKFKFARMRNDGRGVSDAERRALGDPTAPADPDDPRWSGNKPK